MINISGAWEVTNVEGQLCNSQGTLWWKRVVDPRANNEGSSKDTMLAGRARIARQGLSGMECALGEKSQTG
jgi:hypothetical protein